MFLRTLRTTLLLLGAAQFLVRELSAQLPVLRRGSRGEAVARLQVALSNREFSSGAVDGRFGTMLKAALMDYQTSRGLEPDGVAGSAVWKDLGISPEAGDTAFRSYTLTEVDTTGLTALPDEWEARAQLQALPYETVLERLAERFQASRDYLVALNPAAAWPNPGPGASIRVPGVRYETVERVVPADRPRGPGEVAGAADSLAAHADSATAGLRAEWERHAPAGVQVHVSPRQRAVHVVEGEKFVARYPATVGSRQFPNPEGEWKIVSQVYAPDYRYDERYLETGRRSEQALRVPPGPNNIVGLIWMGLDKEGFGLHGAHEPETIGAAASHGCVRLTNWDAQRLARRVGIGTPVTISH